MGGLFGNKTNLRLNWRALVAIAVAYAVAAQSLLIALGGFALAAPASDAPAAFELCLHDGGAAPALPVGAPTHVPCTHCIFCFAGAHHAVIGSSPAPVQSAPYEIVAISQTAGD